MHHIGCVQAQWDVCRLVFTDDLLFGPPACCRDVKLDELRTQSHDLSSHNPSVSCEQTVAAHAPWRRVRHAEEEEEDEVGGRARCGSWTVWNVQRWREVFPVAAGLIRGERCSSSEPAESWRPSGSVRPGTHPGECTSSSTVWWRCCSQISPTDDLVSLSALFKTPWRYDSTHLAAQRDLRCSWSQISSKSYISSVSFYCFQIIVIFIFIINSSSSVRSEG